MSKKILQIVLGLASLAPLIIGLMDYLPGVQKYFPAGTEIPTKLDSEFRFMVGAFMGYAFMGFYIARHVTTAIWPLRIMCIGVFIGGLGRLISALTVGPPPTGLYISMVIELLFPLFMVWQNAVVKKQNQKPKTSKNA